MALTCRALCHTQLCHGPPAPQGKLLQVVCFDFYYASGVGMTSPLARGGWLHYNTKQRSLVSCSFSLRDLPSFRDVAHQSDTKGKFAWRDLELPYPTAHIHIYIRVCVCVNGA